MLSILIYRSRMNGQLAQAELAELVRLARGANDARAVTGILLFDGVYFLQMLEGPDQAVQAVYERIAGDGRHTHIVRLLQDYAPRRRFAECGMRLLDLRTHPQGMDHLLLGDATPGADTLIGDRAYKLMQLFAAGRWRDHATESDDAAHWRFVRRAAPFPQSMVSMPSSAPCRFALQPIVDTTHGRISSLEALMRGPGNEPPHVCFAGMTQEQRYRFDLESKAYAFELASKVGIGSCKLSINLLPMSLVQIPDAVQRLAELIALHGLKPQQIMVEITEDEAITHLVPFKAALRRLRELGISVVIDDFGAGFAGLSLLSRFQPDKLKIDRQIVSGIHADGPRQAIVRAIVACCRSLGITTVAEGVETADEWCWLQAAGIDLFQGFLFARPVLDGVSPVTWPVAVDAAA